MEFNKRNWENRRGPISFVHMDYHVRFARQRGHREMADEINQSLHNIYSFSIGVNYSIRCKKILALFLHILRHPVIGKKLCEQEEKGRTRKQEIIQVDEAILAQGRQQNEGGEHL